MRVELQEVSVGVRGAPRSQCGVRVDHHRSGEFAACHDRAIVAHRHLVAVCVLVAGEDLGPEELALVVERGDVGLILGGGGDGAVAEIDAAGEGAGEDHASRLRERGAGVRGVALSHRRSERLGPEEHSVRVNLRDKGVGRSGRLCERRAVRERQRGAEVTHEVDVAGGIAADAVSEVEVGAGDDLAPPDIARAAGRLAVAVLVGLRGAVLGLGQHLPLTRAVAGPVGLAGLFAGLADAFFSGARRPVVAALRRAGLAHARRRAAGSGATTSCRVTGSGAPGTLAVAPAALLRCDQQAQTQTESVETHLEPLFEDGPRRATSGATWASGVHR